MRAFRGPAAAAVLLVVVGGVWVASRSSVPSGPATEGPAALFPWEMDPPPPSLVPLEEIRSGGPPPDGIPPIDEPKFVPPRQAREWLGSREPVLSLVHRGRARAYPLQILTWHEIVNDTVGGDPVSVTFCPLCNSGIAFDRRVEDQVLDFGTSGRLYRSNLVMYDRQTKSLWLQFTGRAVTGRFMGTDLRNLPVQMISFADFASAHPDGEVLSRDTGFEKSYGMNPYVGYDDVGSRPFLFDAEADGRLPPMERVVTVTHKGESRAYRYRTLRDLARAGTSVITDEVGGRKLVIFYRPGTASALDAARIASSRDVGATGVFVPEANGRELTFEASGDGFTDRETGSVWNILGEATAGELAGSRLEGVVHDDTFWFVWSVFRPTTTVWEPPD